MHCFWLHLNEVTQQLLQSASNAHYHAKMIPFSLSEINSNENDYIPFDRYSETKLANVLFTMEAQRRIEELSKHVYVNSVHPGMVATEFVRESNVKIFVGEYLQEDLSIHQRFHCKDCLGQ